MVENYFRIWGKLLKSSTVFFKIVDKKWIIKMEITVYNNPLKNKENQK